MHFKITHFWKDTKVNKNIHKRILKQPANRQKMTPHAQKQSHRETQQLVIGVTGERVLNISSSPLCEDVWAPYLPNKMPTYRPTGTARCGGLVLVRGLSEEARHPILVSQSSDAVSTSVFLLA